MLSSNLLRQRHSTIYRRYKRTFVTECLQNFTNAYLDLSIALPYPAGWPAYSTTIILLGATSRMVLLPLSIWARRREVRMEQNVVPYLNAYKAKLHEKIRQELKNHDSEEARNFYMGEVQGKLKVKRDELLRKYHCTPWITLLIPPLAQVPVFMGLSTIFLRAANEPGSVLRNEGFLTLISLSHADTTMTFPVLLGLVSLATVETSHWFMTEERARSFALIRRRESDREEHGQLVINPRRYVKSMMRGLSLGRIILAAMIPGSVAVYWLTSSTFGLFVSWLLNYITRRKWKLQKTP